MSPSTAESVEINFSCELVEKIVKFEIQYAVRISRAGKRLGRDTVKTDCSNKDDCRVADHSGPQTTYDWSQCIYLHPQTR